MKEMDQLLRQMSAIASADDEGGLRHGFSGRVMARIAAGETLESSFDPWLDRMMPRAALAALLLCLVVAGWNVSSSSEGSLSERLLNLPAITLSNGLASQGEL
jgi:hypothetical protein